jgi:hypothetical protein
MRMIELMPIVALLLTGCATDPVISKEAAYTRPDTTYEEYQRDRRQCIKEAGRPMNTFVNEHPGFVRVAPIVSQSRVTACMKDRGYVQSPTGFTPPPGGDALCAKC